MAEHLAGHAALRSPAGPSIKQASAPMGLAPRRRRMSRGYSTRRDSAWPGRPVKREYGGRGPAALGEATGPPPDPGRGSLKPCSMPVSDRQGPGRQLAEEPRVTRADYQSSKRVCGTPRLEAGRRERSRRPSSFRLDAARWPRTEIRAIPDCGLASLDSEARDRFLKESDRGTPVGRRREPSSQTSCSL